MKGDDFGTLIRRSLIKILARRLHFRAMTKRATSKSVRTILQGHSRGSRTTLPVRVHKKLLLDWWFPHLVLTLMTCLLAAAPIWAASVEFVVDEKLRPTPAALPGLPGGIARPVV